ncbi:MAG: hypothetical protein CL607_19360 [Anaerolineaceae bacterium]|nr:hypothetical protein [Anaerolineaceae bacterium]
MRIIFLGDSLTWGGYGGNFVDVVAQLMPEHDIINAGVGGDTAINIERRLDDELAEHQPDAAFVMVGGNDAVSYTMPKTRNYYKSSKKIKPDGIVTPEQHADAIHNILMELLGQRILTGLGLAPTEYNAELLQARRQYADLARQEAEKLRVPVLDLFDEFAPEQPVDRDPVDLKFIQVIGQRSNSGWSDYEAERQHWGYTYTFDGMHLLPETAKLYGKRIAAFLTENVL